MFLARERVPRVLCPISFGLIAVLAVCALTAAPADVEANGAGAALCGPSFTYQSDQTQNGITEVQVSYASGGSSVQGYLYLPAGTNKCPGVLFNHDGVEGVISDVRRRARDLAEMGFIVFAPVYRTSGPKVGSIDVAEAELNQVLDAAGALAKHPRIEDPKLAIVGSSHGALLSMLAVMESPKQFACLAQASGACDVPRVAKNVKIPVFLQHGWKDEVVDIGDAMYLGRSMREAGNSWAKLHEYSLLGHGLWYWNDTTRYTPDQVAQAKWAWDDLTAFLARQMGS